MLFQSIISQIVTLLARGANANAKSLVADIKKAATAWRPDDLDVDGPLRRVYFKGQHAAPFMRWVSTVYKEAAANNEIHPVTVNYLRTWAEHDADIYRVGQPQRFIKDNEPATARMKALAKAAKLHLVQPDAEVKSHAAQEMFLKAIRNPITDDLQVSEHWPDHVWIVPNPAAPLVLNEAHFVMIQIRPHLFELWRPIEEDDKRGWIVEHIDEQEESTNPITRVLEKPYFGRLPIVPMYSSLPEASPYLDDGADLITLANNYMLAMTDAFHVTRMQGHSAVWVSSDEEVKLSAGPGGATWLPEGAQMGALQTEAQIDEHRALMNDYAAAVARSRTQSPRAYTTNPVPLNSGVALRTDNQITEEKRPQRVALMEEHDKELMQVLDEVDRLMKPTNPRRARIPGPALDVDKMEVVFPRAPTIEDPTQKQIRLGDAADRGWIPPERAAVEAGYYETVSQAEGQVKPPPVAEKSGLQLGDQLPGERGPAPALTKGDE